MKKNFAKLFVTLLLLLAVSVGLIACGNNGFSVSDDFKDKNSSSALSVNGGFIAETKDFYYVINGLGSSTADNEFGTPVKGALVAVKKADMTKCAVIVPKLFVSSDYNAGIYVYDGYVYFATPSTDKDLSGNAKNSFLTFAKAKLDGSDYTEFLTVSGLSSEFRYYKNGDAVCLAYYNSEDTSLNVYDTKTKVNTVIAKTDDEATESLGAYKFFDNANLDKGIVAYTVTVYKGEYIEETQRTSEKYNKIYLYKAGAKEAEVYKDGSKATLKDDSYEIKAIVDGTIVYKLTSTVYSSGKVFEGDTALENETVYDATFIKDGASIYTYDSTNKVIVKDKVVFAKVSDLSTLLFVKDGFVYYTTAENVLYRISEDATVAEKVSEDTVNASWYKAVILGDYLFYLDDSVAGASNVKYVKINVTAQEEKDDDGNVTAKYLEDQKFICDSLRSDDDKASEVDALCDSLGETLDGGKITEKTMAQVKVIEEKYAKLSEDAKESIEGCYKELEKYHDAEDIGKKCKDLEGIEFEIKTDAKENSKYKTAFEGAKTKFASIEEKGQDYVTAVCNLMEGNTYYWYNYAKENIFKD